ncbi:hypothetical protein SEA_WOFFORD_244 [Streptomyces phage Wofford]|uniref:Uncharacterized protein n=1 Tax=Streptomyces phage Wofford TaxID=2283267 RepID=A0A345MA59_9CAUD|nr:hypothetical protein HWB78_gp074 [Streptomyces phage Wollford]AXH67380.1 hypothetical protein SEA_WOFFORD_244 [Streptomyces phage Wollford]
MEIGDIVILANDPDAGSGWEGLMCEVTEINESRGGYTWVRPFSNRPDGFKKAPFFWKTRNMQTRRIEDPGPAKGALAMIVVPQEEIDSNPNLAKWQGFEATVERVDGSMVRIRALSPRPDGNKILSFYWEKKWLIFE